MDLERSKKTRSLGTESKTSRQPVSNARPAKRPELGDRHNSAPLVARRKHSDAKQYAEDTRSSGRTARNQQAGSRHDGLTRISTNPSSAEGSEYDKNDSMSSNPALRPFVLDDLPLITFAVVGTSGVGKSTFVQNALDPRNPRGKSLSSITIRLGGSFYRLQLIETPRESIGLDNGNVLWPYASKSDTSPEIDGVLYLYDVSDKSSLEGIPDLLAALCKAEVITCLVACKVDMPLCDRAVPATLPDIVRQRYPSILLGESDGGLSDSAQQCLLKIVQQSLGIPAGHHPEKPTSDSHAASHFPPRKSSRAASASSSPSRSRSNSRHIHVSSKSRENLLKAPPSTVLEFEDEKESPVSSADEIEPPTRSPPKTSLRLVTRDIQPRSPSDHPYTPLSTTDTYITRTRPTSKVVHGIAPSTPDSLRDAMDMGTRSYRTFLDMDDESVHDSPLDDIRDEFQKTSLGEETPLEGVSFAELVNRLLAPPTSKGDSKFIPSFLCLYRVFATPKSLLMAIIDAFVRTEQSNLAPIPKATELLRCLGVLGTWTTYYPGDFASAAVWDMAVAFVNTIERDKAYAAAAKQIANNLQTSVPDDDEDWAFSDTLETGRSRGHTTSHKGSVGTFSSKDSRHTPRQQIRFRDDDRDSDVDDNGPTPSSPRHSATNSSASSIVKGYYVTSQTSDLLHNLETAREKVQKLRMIPHNQLSKVQWHQFMSCSTDELAVEITRIDWTVYSAIRPREFVRYAMVSSSQRAQAGQTDYIGMMTRHFNHLALFVAGMILLRDKPKHRAKMLEKFMDLAWKVRQLNNYHALGAIVAALNGEEIVRLSQTQELVSNERHKQFLRLKILMGHQKSHAAYRMAWDNSSAERIPFLPRIQEDLIKAATANPTFVGGQIKWGKFELMGETLVGIQKSQEQPYIFPDKTARGQEIEKLVLETKILESGENCADPQQELYERSKHVEPISSGEQRKKFDWLRR